ncbi:MAG: hypothetical protein M0R00_00645 [Candidatus Omnitrophica bacterium]|jgi:hypothetical protein|nr:hypothetical protein [Candidatus Omnitrophota bacterium]
MDQQKQEKWYFKTWPLAVSFLCVGPLMLPLVWINPRFSVKTKAVASVVIIAASYFMGVVLLKSFTSIFNYYSLAFSPY